MDFKSNWRIHIIAVSPAPHNEIGVTKGLMFNIIVGNIVSRRSNPYPPSFNRILAKIIDPAAGASTWALGSHKCVKYIGILTKNAIVKAILKNVDDFINWYGIKNMVVPIVWWRSIILASKGKEAVTV